MSTELNEENVRSRWLKTFKLCLIFLVVAVFFTFESAAKFLQLSAIRDPVRYPFIKLVIGIAMAVCFLIGASVVYLLYHCGYKKRGTKFLGFILIFISVFHIWMVVVYSRLLISSFSYLVPTALSYMELFFSQSLARILFYVTRLVAFLIFTVIRVKMYIMHWKLYRVNRVRKRRSREIAPAILIAPSS